MIKQIIFFATLLLLSACEQQKQASAEVGAIIDKATTDINNAAALAAEKQKEVENVDAPSDAKN
jgi:hypothetical protein